MVFCFFLDHGSHFPVSSFVWELLVGIKYHELWVAELLDSFPLESVDLFLQPVKLLVDHHEPVETLLCTLVGWGPFGVAINPRVNLSAGT